jgi:uncharacterized protein YcbX
MRVSSIHTYPIKGCYRLSQDRARVEPWGLAGDRRWLIVDPDGVAITQRDHAELTQLRPLRRPEGTGIVLRTSGWDDLDVPEPTGGDLIEVKVWAFQGPAMLAGSAADDWLSKALDRPVRLVFLDDPTRRAVEPEHSEPTDRVSFADGFPVLLTNEASLAALNDWVLAESAEEPLPMTRFRPNLVVAGAPAWAEDGWVGGRLRIGRATFRAPKPCDRCVVTTTDQETGERGREPLRVLARHRNVNQLLLFGLNLIPDGTGEVAVGDPVEAIDRP